MPNTRPISDLLDPIMRDPERRYRVLLGVQAGRVSQILGQMLEDALDGEHGTEEQIQHDEDFYLKTLREYIEMLGGELVIQAVFPNLTVRMEPSGDTTSSQPTAPGFDNTLSQEHTPDV